MTDSIVEAVEFWEDLEEGEHAEVMDTLSGWSITARRIGEGILEDEHAMHDEIRVANAMLAFASGADKAIKEIRKVDHRLEISVLDLSDMNEL